MRLRAFCLAVALGLGLSPGVRADIISEVEPNNTFATAQNVTGNFSLFTDPNVFNSATTPHVTINAANGGFDFFRFTTNAAGIVNLDIDSTPTNTTFDTMIHLWDGAGTLLFTQDDNGGDAGDGPGLVGGAFNSGTGLAGLNLAAGDYVVGVGTFISTGSNGGTYSNPAAPLGTYTLNITANVPEPVSILVFGIAAVGFCGQAIRRRRQVA